MKFSQFFWVYFRISAILVASVYGTFQIYDEDQQALTDLSLLNKQTHGTELEPPSTIIPNSGSLFSAGMRLFWYPCGTCLQVDHLIGDQYE